MGANRKGMSLRVYDAVGDQMLTLRSPLDLADLEAWEIDGDPCLIAADSRRYLRDSFTDDMISARGELWRVTWRDAEVVEHEAMLTPENLSTLQSRLSEQASELLEAGYPVVPEVQSASIWASRTSRAAAIRAAVRK